MREPKSKICAELRKLKENAGELWCKAFIEQNGKSISRRAGEVGVVYWEGAGKMPLDVFSYTREAGLCFWLARYLATIVLSSSVVEVILNRDRRTRNDSELRRVGKWATLNNSNLKVAEARGLPATVLLSDGESLESPEPISFVHRRNKAAHGDILHIIRELSDYDPVAEEEALDQLTKADRFLVEWFNTAPDVQECHIRNHRWPAS